MIIIGLLTTLACKSDIGFDGTLVGNPGRGVASPAENSGIRYNSGKGQLNNVQYAQDNDGFDSQPILEDTLDREVNLFDTLDAFPLQSGNWTGLKLNFTSIELNGVGNDPFALTLENIEITIVAIESDIEVESDGAYYIELGQTGWLTLDLLENTDSGQIDPTDPIAAEIAETLSTQSAMFVDEDKDGSLSDEERSDQLLAGGANRNDHLESDDGGPEATDGD